MLIPLILKKKKKKKKKKHNQTKCRPKRLESQSTLSFSFFPRCLWINRTSIYAPAHEIMARFVLRKVILQTHMHSHSGARCLNFGRTLRLLPYFMCANSECSGETARMRRLAWAFAGRLCDKHHNLMSWLICCHEINKDLFQFLGSDSADRDNSTAQRLS